MMDDTLKRIRRLNMRSDTNNNSIRRVVTMAAMVAALAGCGGGGGSKGAPPVVETPKDNPDKRLVEEYPGIKYLYFLGDDYRELDANGNPLVRSYQIDEQDNLHPVSRVWPAEILRPKVAPSQTTMTYAHAVLKERARFWYLPPDQSSIRPLTRYAGTICDAWTYFHGVTRANAGVHAQIPGDDGLCFSADDNYVALPLNASEIQEAKPVPRAIARGLPLLDGELKLLGHLYAGANEAIQVLDADGQLINELGIADGASSAIKHFAGDRAVLLIGSRLYLVRTTELVQPGFDLPAPVYQFATQPSDDALRLDSARVYVIDGARLVGIGFESGQVESNLDLSGDYESLAFGGRQVFSRNHVIVQARAGATEHLLALSKADGSQTRLEDFPLPLSSGSYHGEHYLATADYIYFNHENPAQGENGYKARIWRDSGDQLTAYRHYDHARWHFFQAYSAGGTSHGLLLLQSVGPHVGSRPEDYLPAVDDRGFFRNPRLYLYDPKLPDLPDVEPARSTRNQQIGNIPNGYVRIRELSDRQSEQLLYTIEKRQAIGNDPLDIYLYRPGKQHIPVSPEAGVCERAISTGEGPSTAPLCKPS